MKKNSAHKIKIMLVEGEAAIALKLEQMLTQMGYCVAGISHSGEEALEKAAGLDPDLILLNTLLPGKMDGIEVAEVVKSELDIPVIFLTALAEDKIIERAEKTVPCGCIFKPFLDREIKVVVELALHKKKMEKKLRKAHEALEHRIKKRTTELDETLETLKRSETELAQYKLILKRLNQELMDTHQALSVVANNIDKEKQKLEEQFFTLCSGKIIPMLKNLQQDQRCEKRQADIELMISYLKEAFQESSRYQIAGYYLSEQEMRVALMIKNGLTNQQIADMLCISLHTVKTHRKHIRNKFNITNPKTNLVSYLTSRFDCD